MVDTKTLNINLNKNNMKHEFYEDVGFGGRTYSVPGFDILDKEYKILEHLSGLSGEQVREIVENLEKVKRGEKILRKEGFFKGKPFKIINDYVDLGVDAVGVYAYGPKAEDKALRNKCVIEGNYSDYYKEVPFEEIYTLMKDYLAEIDKWEKRTGMKKPGW
ncbi:hypothetical protein CSA08_02010 [Candidatus Gracilibacteria bacterium]|nr:MAG: hypothetical protein CSA08_02010 [Candidatus Gracilibacteria bacterium]